MIRIEGIPIVAERLAKARKQQERADIRENQSRSQRSRSKIKPRAASSPKRAALQPQRQASR